MALTDRQKLFIKFYIESGNARGSAIKAGYSEGNASKAARELLKENVHVMRALRDIREAPPKVPEEYNLKAAMAEADEAIAIARTTENAASFITAVKLKAQLMKILDDKPAGAQFQIMISGIGGAEEKTVVSVAQAGLSISGRDSEEKGET
jgi:phage terminase small subunit